MVGDKNYENATDRIHYDWVRAREKSTTGNMNIIFLCPYDRGGYGRGQKTTKMQQRDAKKITYKHNSGPAQG